ncbi:MAG: septum formation initiator family protein [Gammaproteobacteria bacterium]|jgi:cell division protein FtsB
MKKTVLKILTFFLVGVLVLFQYRLWFAKDGVAGAWRLRHLISEQNKSNQDWQSKNNHLRAEIQNLKQGGEAIEAHARDDIGMIKQGEVFYRTVVMEKPGIAKKP